MKAGDVEGDSRQQRRTHRAALPIAGGLYDLMASIHGGMAAAIRSRNRDATVLAAQIELDAVDLLEDFFAHAYKRGAGAVPDRDPD